MRELCTSQPLRATKTLMGTTTSSGMPTDMNTSRLSSQLYPPSLDGKCSLQGHTLMLGKGVLNGDVVERELALMATAAFEDDENAPECEHSTRISLMTHQRITTNSQSTE